MQQPTINPTHPAGRQRPGRRRRPVLPVLAAAAVAAASCASHRTLDLMAGGGRALAATAVVDPAAERPSPDVAAAALAGFLALFDDFRPEAIRERAAAIYAPQAYFHDGFVELEGAAAIGSYLARTATATRDMHITLEDQAVSGGEVYLRWVMRFTTSGRRSVTVAAPGMTHLRLDRSGRIVYHRDYWDAGTALAAFVPGGSPVLRAVRKRL